MPIAFCGYTILPVKEGINFLRSLFLWNPENIIPSLVGMDIINMIENGITQSVPTACRLEVMQKDFLHLLWLDVWISEQSPVISRHIDKWHLITCTDARNRLDTHIDTKFPA